MIQEEYSKRKFLEQLKYYGFISEAAQQDILSKVCCVHRSKGHRIIRDGQMATDFFIVEKGMVRAFLKRESTDTTLWFAYEAQKAVSISSLFANKPSHETVECIEDCDLLYISNRDLQELYHQYECMNTIGRKMVEEYCSILDDRCIQLQVMSATERYKDLMEYEPEIIKRAPLSCIASFLGISQETLSRIRHNW